MYTLDSDFVEFDIDCNVMYAKHWFSTVIVSEDEFNNEQHQRLQLAFMKSTFVISEQ